MTTFIHLSIVAYLYMYAGMFFLWLCICYRCEYYSSPTYE